MLRLPAEREYHFIGLLKKDWEEKKGRKEKREEKSEEKKGRKGKKRGRKIMMMMKFRWQKKIVGRLAPWEIPFDLIRGSWCVVFEYRFQ